MVIKRCNDRVPSERLVTLLHDLLEAPKLCTIATVTPDSKAHINTAYFASSLDLRLVWLSDRAARHSLNLQTNSSAAIAVFDSHEVWGDRDRGLQLFGSAAEVDEQSIAEVEQLYRARFPRYERGSLPYRFYVLRTRRAKLFDERQLGAGVFVTADVSGGDVVWLSTEVYESGDGADS